MFSFLTVIAYGALPDPTQPYKYNQRAVSFGKNGLYVSSIINRGAKSIAKVNGSYVEVGDHIDGSRVLVINPQEVQFIKNNKKFTIHINNAKDIRVSKR